jgi:hypothetical protein
MRMKGFGVAVLGTLAATGLMFAGHLASARSPASYAPRIDPKHFRAGVDHPFFPLVPGTRYLYRETSAGDTVTEEVTVTGDTRRVMGVACVVVHDVEREGDHVAEETWDWYAQDRAGNVWYMGEDTKAFLPRGHTSTAGSWQAGLDGALPGIIMQADPVPGDPYRQEYHRGHAEDMGQVVGIVDAVTVPFGSFDGCILTRDWSALESGSENKWYAKGVGLIRTESTSGEVSVLVSVTRAAMTE